MSYRPLEVDVIGRDSGFMALLNRMNAGLSRVGTGLRGGRSEASLFSKQLMAIGTTARYWLSGQLVFGVMGAVRSLGEFKTQLGEIDAMAAAANRQGNFQGLGSSLEDVGSQALLMSNKFGIAVTEVETYMQRFYTAFRPSGTAKQNQQEMEAFVNAHLALVTMLGSRAGDPNALAGGLAALVRQMPGGEQHPGQSAETLSNYFARIITRTPNLTGQDIASAAGRLASAKTLSNMTMPQLLSAFGVAAETGGSPAVIIRGMTQLLGQSLLHPTRPASLRAYQAAGLPTDPNALSGLGGEHVLERLITFAQAGGPAGSAGRKTNLDMIYNAFSRQESVRQFVNILANGGVPALNEFRKSLQAAAKDNLVQTAAQRSLRQSSLMRMTQATHNLGISLVQGADWPLETFIADPVIAASNFAARHRTTTQAVVGGAVGLGAANALRRLGALKRFGKFGKFLGTATGIEQAAIGGAISKEELPAAIAGGAGDGSRANPLWVIISPLSWSIGSPGGFSMPTKQSEEQKAIGVFKSIWNRAKNVGGIGVAAGRGIGIAGGAVVSAAVAIPVVYNEVLGHLMGHGRAIPKGHPLLAKYARMEPQGPNDMRVLKPLPKDVLSIMDRFAGGKLSADRAEALLRRIQPGSQGNPIHIEGAAKLDVTVTQKYPDGTSTHTTHRGVPVRLWTAKQFPSQKGKPGSRKGSGK